MKKNRLMLSLDRVTYSSKFEFEIWCLKRTAEKLVPFPAVVNIHGKELRVKKERVEWIPKSEDARKAGGGGCSRQGNNDGDQE